MLLLPQDVAEHLAPQTMGQARQKLEAQRSCYQLIEVAVVFLAVNVELYGPRLGCTQLYKTTPQQYKPFRVSQGAAFQYGLRASGGCLSGQGEGGGRRGQVSPHRWVGIDLHNPYLSSLVLYDIHHISKLTLMNRSICIKQKRGVIKVDLIAYYFVL